MQRLRLLYTQLLMQAAFFQLQSASKLKVSDSTRDEVEVYNTIPHNVQCTPIVLEHDTPIKICKAGSVGLDNSTINALALQRLVSYGRELCKTQIIGSHNSALTLADVSLLFSDRVVLALNQWIHRVTALAIMRTWESQITIFFEQAAK